MNAAGFAAAVVDVMSGRGDPAEVRTGPSDKDRAVAVARVILRAPNIDEGSDIALLARELLAALGLRP